MTDRSAIKVAPRPGSLESAGPSQPAADDGTAAAHDLVGDFANLQTSYEPARKLLWYYLQPRDRPCFTEGLLADIRGLQKRLFRRYHNDGAADDVRYLVAASTLPGMFNLGGDLAHFLELIRRHDRSGLEGYAHACIKVLHVNMIALELPLITFTLVQGDALGGGFEAAISSNVVVAERQARFGLPEVLFNLFPGMGGYSLLARRLGPVEAERLILSGKIYTAEELHEMGAVDVLCDDGCGEAAVYDVVEQYDRKFNSYMSVYRSRHQVFPITFDELSRIAEVWVEAALRLNRDDLHKIELLAAAQRRRWRKVVNLG